MVKPIISIPKANNAVFSMALGIDDVFIEWFWYGLTLKEMYLQGMEKSEFTQLK